MKKISRMDFLKAGARGGVLLGLLALCAVLVGRKEKFSCTQRCGGCVKNDNGRCSL